jgi:putative tricarboxylic transport membrane protein
VRKSLIMSQGDFSIFIMQPLAAVFVVVALFLLISPLIPGIGKKRREIPKKEAS